MWRMRRRPWLGVRLVLDGHECLAVARGGRVGHEKGSPAYANGRVVSCGPCGVAGTVAGRAKGARTVAGLELSPLRLQPPDRPDRGVTAPTVARDYGAVREVP